MADSDEEVLKALKDFAREAWGYTEGDRAQVVAEILMQCWKSMLTGGTIGGLSGAVIGGVVFSIPMWALGAFGGIVGGAMRCTGLSTGAMGMHQILQTTQNSTPIMDMSLLVAKHRGHTRLKQEMDVLVNRRAGKSSV